MREAEQSGVEAYSPCCLHCFHIAISYSELVLFSQHCPSRSSCNPCTPAIPAQSPPVSQILQLSPSKVLTESSARRVAVGGGGG